ncbi:MAG: protein kinase [Planctomycetaceae bacterium]|nr:protein kinase [Planctomycetaceae bacterium]
MDSTDARDEQLAAILQQVTDAPAESRPSLEKLTADHPDLADDLRELWGAVMIADAVASRDPDESIETTAPFAGGGRAGVDARPPSELGDFQLLEEIGRGGMGVVYRARQRSLDREVAVKVMLRGAEASQGDQARFQFEAEAAARLDHPSIVPIYETGVVDGWRYFGMKLISGQTLSKVLAEGPMEQVEAARLVMRVARAIQYAHEHGVVHRDLKPANILLDSAGRPFVTDFGLAKRDTTDPTLTTTGAILGTPSYMAPEQAGAGRGEVGPASDVFSLGAILYALLTGRPPFQGTSPVNTVLAVLEQDPLPPRLMQRSLDRDLEMIALRCLQKPPELRYASAGALADDLQAYLTGDDISARSGKFSHVVARIFRDTHHATVLENWGMLWMWHAAVLLVLCSVTNWLNLHHNDWPATRQHWPYVAVWGGGLAIWAPIFWALRRRAGPVTAIERHIAHAWGGSIVAVVLLFVVEALLGLPVLTLSPVLGLIAGAVFTVKAGILAGAFYVHAFALFACALTMALMQHLGCPYGISLFGLVAAAVFFVPGLKYYRQAKTREGVGV